MLASYTSVSRGACAHGQTRRLVVQCPSLILLDFAIVLVLPLVVVYVSEHLFFVLFNPSWSSWTCRF